MKKILFIDSNNMAIRCAFANKDLKNSSGISSGVHFGCFQSLISLKRKFKDYQFLMVWDGKSKRRKEESELGVKNGIVPEAYKENRKKAEQPPPLLDFYAQSDFLKRGIGITGIPQLLLNDRETDDVINVYCKILKKDNEIIVITSDHDYFQLLDDHVSIYDCMKQQLITKESFVEEYGIQPNMWIDVGALMGDSGDNIFGVCGWGEKTALKEIKKHGTWQKVIEAAKIKYEKEIKKYPDLNTLTDGEIKFKELVTKKSEKDRLIYPEISFNMPCTGLLYAFDKEEFKAAKTEIMLLVFQERVKLAYSLKKMDDNISDLPAIEQGELNKERLLEYFSYYDIETLKDAIDLFETGK